MQRRDFSRSLLAAGTTALAATADDGEAHFVGGCFHIALRADDVGGDELKSECSGGGGGDE